MAAIREAIDREMQKVNSYDAGRPNTAVLPKDDGKFKPAESVGMNPAHDRVSASVRGAMSGVAQIGESMAGTSGGVSMRAPELRGNMPTAAQLQDRPFNYPRQPGMREVLRTAGANIAGAYDGDAVAKFDATRKGFSGRLNMPVRSPDVSSLRAPANGPVMPTQREQLLQNPESFVPGDQKTIWPAVADAASAFSARAANAGEGVVKRPASAPSVQPDIEPAAGPVSTTSPQPMSTERELQFRRANANQAGMRAMDSGGPQMTPEQVRATILKRNGMTGNEVPATAKPGLTLSATPATPRKPLAYNGAFANTGNAEDALFRKRMEVLKADQASGQASRSDYVSPFETNPNRRAELDAQQRKNIEDIAARQISEATTRMLNDQATGLTSDRNLAMMPYEQRRAVINDRRNLIALNADMQQKRMEEEGKAAGRKDTMTIAGMEDTTKRRGQDMEVDVQRMKEGGETSRAQMTDATTRRGQDVEQQTNLTNAEIAARSKALDREATLEAARIRKTVPVDRVKIEAIKGYNKFIGEQVALKPELQDDPAFLERAMKMYGLSAADLSTPMMQGVTPENDDEFPTT